MSKIAVIEFTFYRSSWYLRRLMPAILEGGAVQWIETGESF